jgi:hypothetical protein
VGAIYGVIGLIVVALLFGSAHRAKGRRRSIERHHHAMDVLAQISGHGQAPDQGDQRPPPMLVDSSPREPTLRPSVSNLKPQENVVAAFPQVRSDSAPQTALVCNDVGHSVVEQNELSARRRTWLRHRADSQGWWPGRMRGAGLIAAVMLVLAAGGVIVNASFRHPASPHAGRTTSRRAGANTTTVPPRTEPLSSTTTTSTTSTTSTTVPTSALGIGTIALAAVSPDSATAGASVTFFGTGFVASSGYLVATFNGRLAPTRCSNEERCVVTVPAGLSGSVTVRLQSASAKSNALLFRYD